MLLRRTVRRAKPWAAAMWTIPNLLTLARIVAIGPLVFAIFAGWWQVAFTLFAAASITDFLDGWLVRRWNQQSDLGRFLDPIADKLIVAAVIVAIIPESGVLEYPAGVLAILIISRELLVSGLREYLGTKGVIVHVTSMAKWKTAMQLVALGLILGAAVIGHLQGFLNVYEQVHLAGMVLLLASAILAWITAFDYLRAGLRHMEPPR